MIATGLAQGDSAALIARRIGRCRQTVSREIRRGAGPDGVYRPAAAQAAAQARLARPKIRKLDANPALRERVVDPPGGSGPVPGQIAARLRFENPDDESMRICHEQIHPGARVRRVRLLVWWQFPRGFRPGSSARAAGIVGAPVLRPRFTRSAPTMPSHQSAVSTLIREVLADPDLAHDEVFRRLLQAGLQDLVDAEAAAVIGAQRYERTPERTNRRNGKRLKTVATTAGEVELAIPKLRTGSFFPSLLHPRRRVDKALYAVICQAWIEGVSTRKVDDLVKALGNESGISRSTVSRICKDIDEGVKEFLARSLDHTWFPYLFVDATYLDVRVGHRVVCRALVVATGVSAEGRREILGMALGDAETVDFWTSFLRSLRERGLKVPSPEDPTGVVLVTSDAHAGIRAAVRAILPGASWGVFNGLCKP